MYLSIKGYNNVSYIYLFIRYINICHQVDYITMCVRSVVGMARYRKKKDKEFDDKLKESRLRFPSGERLKSTNKRGKAGGKNDA